MALHAEALHLAFVPPLLASGPHASPSLLSTIGWPSHWFTPAQLGLLHSMRLFSMFGTLPLHASHLSLRTAESSGRITHSWGRAQ